MFTSAPERPMVVRVLVIGKMWPVAGPWITARENRLSFGSSTICLPRSRPVIPPGSFASLVLRGGAPAGGAAGGEATPAGAAAAAAGIPAIVPGGSVIDAIRGFSMSIEPPHFAQRVFALGRSPSLLSSNLYFAWQAGQTMIIGCNH